MNVWTVGANISQMDSCSIPLWFNHPHILWILLTFLSNHSSLLYFQALHQLYYDPNIENKNLAQKWLMQAQVSPQAWQFCWALLSPDKVQCTHKHLHGHTHTEKALIHPLYHLLQVPEIQYFGANALHTKISRYWSDIPTDQYESLKTQLFSQIACFSSGSKMVLTRLCVALASLALNTMPEAWPGAVAEMVRVFQEEGGGVDGRARCLALLELLTVLPEEFQTSRLPQYRKGQVRPSPKAAGGDGHLSNIHTFLWINLFISRYGTSILFKILLKCEY